MMYGHLQEKLKFTTEYKQLLQNLVIDEKQPGTILHDFGVLLEIFRKDKQTLTPAHQLPLRLLTEINQHLKNPIHLNLKRPAQKSYPHIHGPLDYLNLLQVFVPTGSALQATDNLIQEPQTIEHADHNAFVSQVQVSYDTSERFQFEYETPPLIEQLGPYSRYRLLIQKQPGMLREVLNVQVTLPAEAVTLGISPAPAASYALDRPIIEFRLVLDSDQWIEVIYREP